MNLSLKKTRSFNNRKFIFQFIRYFFLCTLCWFVLLWWKTGVLYHSLLVKIIFIGLCLTLLSFNYKIAKILYLTIYSLWSIFQIIVSCVLFTFFFYFILFPFGYIRRKFFLKNSSFFYSKEKHSYWVEVAEDSNLNRYYRQF